MPKHAWRDMRRSTALSVALIAALGGGGVALATSSDEPTTLSCTATASPTAGGVSVDFAACLVPTPEPATVTVTEPGPTQTVTATVTATPTPTPTPTSGPSPSPSPTSSPTATPSGLIAGATAMKRAGETTQQAIAATEAMFGAKLDALRTFDGGQGFRPWGSQGQNLVPGSVAVIDSFKHSPATVLSGSVDAAFVAYLKSVPARTGWHGWTYFHEPEDNVAGGEFTAKQWRDAYARLINLWVANGRIGGEPVPILMDWTVNPSSGRNPADYVVPGVETYGFDMYQTTAANFDASMTRVEAFIAQHGVDLVVPEFARDERQGRASDATMRTFITGTAPALERAAKVVFYFNGTGTLGDHYLYDRPQAAAAFGALLN